MIAGAVLWLVGRGMSSLVANLIVWGALALGATAVIAGVHHVYDSTIKEPARVEGDQRTIKRLQPQIDKLTSERDTFKAERDAKAIDLKVALDANVSLLASIEGPGGLNDQISGQNKAIGRWQAIARGYIDRNATLTKQLAEKTRAAQAAIDRSLAVIAAPKAVSFEESCRKADAILGDLARRMHAL